MRPTWCAAAVGGRRGLVDGAGGEQEGKSGNQAGASTTGGKSHQGHAGQAGKCRFALRSCRVLPSSASHRAHRPPACLSGRTHQQALTTLVITASAIVAVTELTCARPLSLAGPPPAPPPGPSAHVPRPPTRVSAVARARADSGPAAPGVVKSIASSKSHSRSERHKWRLFVPEALDRPLCHRPRGPNFRGLSLAFIYEIRP